MDITFHQKNITLLSSGALLFKEEKIYCCADLHLGKLIALKDNGVPAPSQSDLPTVEKLFNELIQTKPETIILLGDIFHQRSKNMARLINNFFNQLSLLNQKIIVTLGNHDQFLKKYTINFPKIKWVETHIWEGIYFCHKPMFDKPCICGHIHPGSTKKIGKLTQKKKAFWLVNNTLICPAFGQFTGITSQKMTVDKVFIP